MKTLPKTLLAATVLLACACNTVTKSEVGNPSLDNRTKWHDFLKVEVVPEGAPFDTTMTHISNVSSETAIAKINQALQSYRVKLSYHLSTILQLATDDETDKEGKQSSDESGAKPAVTACVVQGHLYYIGFLDFPLQDYNRAAYEMVGKTIPAIAVVDGEDETKAAWIRTADEDGKPYAIKLHFSTQESGTDDNNIYRHFRNHGYSTALNCESLDSPTIEVDDKWKPYITATYNVNDACGLTNGNMHHPEKLLVLDVQTGDITALDLDDPNTAKDERDPRIEKDFAWIDQIYSRSVVREWLHAWGYNTANYGKTSKLNEMVPDADLLDEVMNLGNTNITFVAYMTSDQPDDSLIGVMTIDPRIGKAKLLETTGTRAMATKSAAINAVKQATHRWDYNVEDVTLHTIYGEPTWEGEVTRPAFDDAGHPYGSLYAGTFLLRADDDLMPAHVAWANTKLEAFNKYQKTLVLRQSGRIGSNVLEMKEITGKVETIVPIVQDGNTTYLITLAGNNNQWEVPIDYVGSPTNEDVFGTRVGDSVFMKYADIINSRTHLTREIHNISKPAQEGNK